MKRRNASIAFLFLCIFALLLPFATAAAPTQAPSGSSIAVGESNSRVTAMQLRLKELGFYPYMITGTYGTVTANAVKAFQKSNGLFADGVCGKQTYDKLFGSSALRKPFTP